MDNDSKILRLTYIILEFAHETSANKFATKRMPREASAHKV